MNFSSSLRACVLRASRVNALASRTLATKNPDTRKTVLAPEFIIELTEETGLKKCDVKKVIQALPAVVKRLLDSDRNVKISNLVTFKTVTLSGRQYYNMHTKEKMFVESHNGVKARPSSSLQPKKA